MADSLEEQEMIHRNLIATVAVAALGLTAAHAPGEMIDCPFTEGILETSWTATLGGDATDWEYGLSETMLEVTDVTDSTSNNGIWAVVDLSQPVSSLDDFQARMSVSYDSDGSNAAMQQLMLVLTDGSGNVVAQAGHNDAWISSSGRRWAWIEDGSCYSPGKNTALFADDFDIMIERTGDEITIRFDDTVVLSGISSTPVEQVHMSFTHYAYPGSFFGTETVDSVGVVPEPCVLMLLCFGGLGLLIRYRRRMRTT